MGFGNWSLVKHMRDEGTLKTLKIIRAFKAIDRKDFVSEEFKRDAYLNIPIPIGHEATTSQPSTIAFMLENLELKSGQKILEIGTGSGYVTALLARIVGRHGKIYSVEYVPELSKTADSNLKEYNFKNIKLIVGDGKDGLPDYAPFDRIAAGAEVSDVPMSWKKQLAAGGIILTPLDSKIRKLTKKSDAEFKEEDFSFFSFVKIK